MGDEAVDLHVEQHAKVDFKSRPLRLCATRAGMIGIYSQARLLETSAGKPLLSIRETTYDSKRVAVEHSHSLLRADRYTATVVSVRK